MDKKQDEGKGRLYRLWLSFSLKQKIWSFTGAVVLAICISMLLNVVTVNMALYGFGRILDDNARSHAFLAAVEEEAEAFAAYARSRTKEDQALYEKACVRTASSVKALPFDYRELGADRYARTWSIKTAYASYEKERDNIFRMQERDSNYVPNLYRIYRMQSYLDVYARRLVQLTLQESSETYLKRVPTLYQFPYWMLAGSTLVIGLILYLAFLMRRSLIVPIEHLAQASKKIARNDFSGENIQVENRDEMGELVAVFNKMKHATIGYITTLEEKHEISELLHKEELERVEMERTLEATKLEVLKSQINPHFLFNTLNMIACMAKLEEADTTERMITSLGNLFRYNLKTTETEVPLAQELKIADDYMYIQQMRFGSRIQYQKKIEVDEGEIIIPSFSLQPIVENAIIHGLSKKEQGGKLYIRVWIRDDMAVISVADSGLGMDEARLSEIRAAKKERKTAKIGIGLGNIYKRLHAMYEGAELKIYSKDGCGTVVQMWIPQRRE